MRIILVLTVLLASLASVRADDEHFATLKAGAEVYTNAVVTSRTATHVYFTHSQGIGSAKLKDLDSAMQTQLHYDSTAAATSELQQRQQDAAYRQNLASVSATNRSSSWASDSSANTGGTASASPAQSQTQTRSSASQRVVVRSVAAPRTAALAQKDASLEKGSVHPRTADSAQKSQRTQSSKGNSGKSPVAAPGH